MSNLSCLCYDHTDRLDRVIGYLLKHGVVSAEQAAELNARHAADEWPGVTIRSWQAADNRRVCLQVFIVLAPRDYAGDDPVQMLHAILQVIVVDRRGGHGGYRMQMGGDLGLLDRHFGSLGPATAYALTLAEIMHAEEF